MLEMKRYTGTKSLRASPMTRGDWNAYRGWTIPPNEDPSDAGYLVEYEDGGKPNDPRHAGYISWSPVDVFEHSYSPSETHADRMRIEHAELSLRMKKLSQFMGTPQFSALDREERERLLAQLAAMSDYEAVLGERIDALPA